MKLADKILNLRKQRGFSQEELAEKLNVSRQAVSRWEVGAAQPDASNILQLSKLFEVTADYLLNDDYESDNDVPAVKSTATAAENKIQMIVGMCVATFGLFGNVVIYILSRFIRAMIPHPVYDNGKIIFYEYSREHLEYSYIHFVREHNLVFLTVLFWILFLAGVIYVFEKNGKVKKLLQLFKRRQ